MSLIDMVEHAFNTKHGTVRDAAVTTSRYDTATLYIEVSVLLGTPLEYITIDIPLPEGVVVDKEELEEIMRQYDEQS